MMHRPTNSPIDNVQEWRSLVDYANVQERLSPEDAGLYGDFVDLQTVKNHSFGAAGCHNPDGRNDASTSSHETGVFVPQFHIMASSGTTLSSHLSPSDDGLTY